jgi:predicted RecB family nuclease
MRWYERATSDPDRARREYFRTKILEYNEDDVRATRHLRWWFSEHDREAIGTVP